MNKCLLKIYKWEDDNTTTEIFHSITYIPTEIAEYIMESMEATDKNYVFCLIPKGTE